MKVRVAAAGVLLLFLIVVPAFPQCTYQQVYSGQFRSTVLDLAIDGSDLWAATSYGVTLYDRSVDPPTFVASIALPDTTRVVRVLAGTVYAGSGSTVRIVRKNGRALATASVVTVPGGAQVNDIAVTPIDLYVATSNGLLQYDLLDLSQPRATLTTSTPTVYSLALQGASLYVADGDASVQVFDISIPSIPQAVGSLATSIPRVTSVRLANGKLYVSDGRRSEVWFAGGSSSSRLATPNFGMTSVAQISGDALFAGAGDRTLNAYDFTTASQPVALFATNIPVSAGTVNRVSAVATGTNRLYVAAGDSGLLTYDTTGFAAPFPLRDFPFGAPASILSLGDHVYVGNTTGGVTEFSQNNAASLTQQRTFDGSRSDVVQDGGNGFLLTSSGATATLWTLQQASVTAVSNATFAKSVSSAVLVGTTAYALLSDSTLWSADVSQPSPAAVKIALNGAAPTSLARSGSSIALADPRSDGTTNVIFFSDPTQAPQTQNIAGVTTTPVALSGKTAAVFTFSGISLVDFGAGTVTVVPQSGGVVARDLAISPSLIIEMTDTNLNVWDRSTLKLTAQYALPRTPAALTFAADAATPIADLATTDGITTVALNSPSHVPTAVATTNANAFYKKVAATADRILLFDGISRVDLYTPAMHHTGSIGAPGMVDATVATNAVYAVFSNGTIGSYTMDGGPLSQTTISDLPDARPLTVATAGGAVWVAISRGCSTGACEKRTLVYNAALSQTTTLPGGIVDLAVNGNRAYALFDLPAEVRTYDISDPLHPAPLATISAEGARTPVSLAFVNGTVYVLGEKLYAYDAGTLTKTGEQFASYTADPASPVSYIDQRLRADGGCAAVGGRTFGATIYSSVGSTWTATANLPSPSPVRSIAAVPGTFCLLTDHSLEIWSTGALPSLQKKHAAR